MGHLNRICRTVIAPSSHAQHLLYTPGTFLSNKKSENPIFPVRSCITKVYILVSTMSSLAILDHQPSFQSIWPLGCVIPSQVLPSRRFAELTDYAYSRSLISIY